MRLRFLFSFLILSLLANPAFATQWYVDGVSGNDNNAGTSATSALQTPWRAISKSVAGDTINIMPTTTYPYFGIYKSGTSTGYITLRGSDPTNPTKVAATGTNFGIDVGSGASYIAIQYFDVQAPGKYYGIHVGTGSHHVIIQGNVIHNAGHGGIGTQQADYITLKGNTIYNTATYTSDGIFGSAISTYQNTDIDASTGTKIIIDGNLIYGNTNTPTAAYQKGTDPDGNGIIIDDSRHTQSNKVAYHGAHLIQNNVVFNNGGHGIYMYNSDHATIVNNTVYYNNRDPYEASWSPGELMTEKAGDVRIYNNILYSDGAAGTTATGPHYCLSIQDGSGGAITSDYSLFYNAANNQSLAYYQRNNTNAVTAGTHSKWGNPLFIMASTDPTKANFQLQSSSPAIGAGTTSYAPSLDFLGASRTAPITIGAYQSASVTSLTPPTSMRIGF